MISTWHYCQIKWCGTMAIVISTWWDMTGTIGNMVSLLLTVC